MWLEVLTVAFVAQLAVLPGEKVQFVVAGLSTRYDPLVVVAAAGSAFAGWTALEVAFGEALRRALPSLALDAVTAGLFLLFAVLLYRSAPAPGESAGERPSPEPDGGVAVPEPADATVLGREVPDRFGGFLPIFAVLGASEFGDKTQLVTIGLTVQYGAHPAIWAGEMLAILPVTLANAYLFHRFAGRVDLRRVHLASAALFAFFGVDTVLGMVTGVSVWETFVGAVSEAMLAVA